MTEYNLKKRFYSKIGEFTYLSGGYYTGYVTVLSGVPYIDNTSTVLSYTSRYESGLYTSQYLKNRDVNETFFLPYNTNDILFGANDFLSYNLFVDKLNKLRENNTFVYSKLFMPDNNLPLKVLSGDNIVDYSFAYVQDSNSFNFTVGSGIVKNILFKDSAINSVKYLSNIKRFTATLKVDTPTDYVIFAITDTGFTTLTGNKEVCNIIEPHSTFVETRENKLTFGSLFDITLSNNFIFITDELNSVIYKYDVGGYFNGDIALGNKRNLIEILGGDGPATANNLFKTPRFIASNKEVIVIDDSGNNVLKVYDLNFNYITRISSLPLRKEQVVSLKINEFYNELFVVTKSIETGKYNLYVIDMTCYRVKNRYIDIPLDLQLSEVINNIEFSKNLSDYYYICTDRRIFKLFISKPTVIVGIYINSNLDYIAGPQADEDNVGGVTPNNQWGFVNKPFLNATWPWSAGVTGSINTDVCDTSPALGIFFDIFKGIIFLPTLFDYDSVVMVTAGRVYFFNEQNRFKSVIKTSDLNRYGNEKPSLSPDEYIQASTVNKELYKIAHDILILKNNIIGRFTGNFNRNNILTLNDYNYNVNFNTFSLIQPEDYYIHENEKALVTVLNRSFSNILNLQEKLINLTLIDKGNTVKRELSLTPNFSCKIIN